MFLYISACQMPSQPLPEHDSLIFVALHPLPCKHHQWSQPDRKIQNTLHAYKPRKSDVSELHVLEFRYAIWCLYAIFLDVLPLSAVISLSGQTPNREVIL